MFRGKVYRDIYNNRTQYEESRKEEERTEGETGEEA